MNHLGLTKEENPMSASNQDPSLTLSTTTTNEIAVQPKDHLISQTSLYLTLMKDDFDDFISKFPDTLYFFAQNSKTRIYTNDDDINTMINAKKTLDRNGFITLNLTYLSILVLTKQLYNRHKIFGLTQRLTFGSGMAKFLVIPITVRATFESVFFKPEYNRISRNIQSKYNFQMPLFREEYEKDPNPRESIRSFLDNRSNNATLTNLLFWRNG